MKLAREFQVNPDHSYSLADGVVVQSAKFGRTQVDVWQDEKPGPIWRGDPPQVVGAWPVRMWRYCVHGELSGVALTEEGAKAKGEKRAWDSSANSRICPSPVPYRHQRSGDDENAEKEQWEAMLAQIDQDFPADMEVPSQSPGM